VNCSGRGNLSGLVWDLLSGRMVGAGSSPVESTDRDRWKPDDRSTGAREIIDYFGSRSSVG